MSARLSTTIRVGGKGGVGRLQISSWFYEDRNSDTVCEIILALLLEPWPTLAAEG